LLAPPASGIAFHPPVRCFTHKQFSCPPKLTILGKLVHWRGCWAGPLMDRFGLAMDSPRQSPTFEVLFDHAEPSPFADEALAPYGNFGFPAPPADRPWIYTNFVQSLDGIVSLLGKHASGAEIAQSRADRWLMDLLRAHADAVIMGMNTLREEQRNRGPESRGIVFQLADPSRLKLRERLGKGRQRNIFVTRALTSERSEEGRAGKDNRS